MAGWSTQQLVEFLAGISACTDERSAMRDAVERAAEALEAEVAALVRDDSVLASTGFAAGRVPELELAAIAHGEKTGLTVPGVGDCHTLTVVMDGPDPGWLIVARGRGEPFDHEDTSVFRGMARVLALSLRQLRLVDSERAQRDRSDREASERRAAEKELAHQALHDGLTGLPNRALLLDRLDRALARANRDRTLAVLFVDLDNFKLINDTLGHHVGDDLLQRVAGRLKNGTRRSEAHRSVATESVARLGGDEFVLLCEGIASAQDAERIAARVASRLAEPCEIAGEKLVITASIGVAISDADSTPDSLLRDADAAMYHAKQRGRARAEVFDDAMRDRLVTRLGREKELRRAIEQDEFFLVYQPLVKLPERSVLGAEALVRWRHPERGVIAPGDFIPLAEETGLITQIDEWVLHHACRQLASWNESGTVGPDFTVGVNISARQIRDGRLLETVSHALAGSQIRPSTLALEITETVLIENSDSPTEILESLRALGVRVVLDDFGTGYSSLSYLQRFPLDALKLDRSFTAEISNPGRGREIVAVLLHLARVLELEVVAEGVETAEQLACLEKLECPVVQGFYLARPMPGCDLQRLLEEREAMPAALERELGPRALA
jgi:diguanylate cyclase (GGDEF)-like protein